MLRCKYSYACKRCAYSYVDEDGQTRSSDTLRRCQSRIIAMTVNRGYIRRQVGRTHYIMWRFCYIHSSTYLYKSKGKKGASSRSTKWHATNHLNHKYWAENWSDFKFFEYVLGRSFFLGKCWKGKYSQCPLVVLTQSKISIDFHFYGADIYEIV